MENHNGEWICIFIYLFKVYFFKNYLFIYVWLHWVFVAARWLFLVAACGLLIMVASPVVEHGL